MTTTATTTTTAHLACTLCYGPGRRRWLTPQGRRWTCARGACLDRARHHSWIPTGRPADALRDLLREQLSTTTTTTHAWPDADAGWWQELADAVGALDDAHRERTQGLHAVRALTLGEAMPTLRVLDGVVDACRALVCAHLDVRARHGATGTREEVRARVGDALASWQRSEQAWPYWQDPRHCAKAAQAALALMDAASADDDEAPHV